MKKLNRKGFTLVELLAVIIILAIVVGISIPAITNIINDSKNNSLGVAADSAEKFVSEQYNLMSVDVNLVDPAFTKIVPSLVTTDTTKTLKSATANDAALLKAMGFDVNNVTELTMKITTTGDVCITITKIPTKSQYFTTAHWKTDGSAPLTGAQNKSKSC